MPGLERVHWFLREQCNLKRCAYCFGPLTEGKANSDKDTELAKLLVQSHVKEVILGGGEPLLANNLESVLQVLKSGNIDVSLHTNGLLLSEGKLDRLQGLVDKIALPIDAVSEEVQKQLRGEGFMNTFDKIMRLADQITSREIGLGWHTVFTAVNYKEIPEIYARINNHKFNDWRIYEYNFELARQAWIKADWLRNEQRIKGYLLSESLVKSGTSEKGGTDSLLADLLRMEEEFAKTSDPRISFVARLDERKDPYAFLMGSGQINYYAWYSDSERKPLGNIFDDGFIKIAEGWEKIRNGTEFDEEDWFQSISDAPLWARLDDGAYFVEEYDDLQPKYRKEVERLADLWKIRNGK